jgi:hypothetical protein
MRKPWLALALAALASPAFGDPMDLDLNRLGAPEAGVWKSIDPSLSDADAAQLARESRQRFAMLSAEMALGLSSFVLVPPVTTGHSGFEFSFEAAYAPVHPQVIGKSAGNFVARDAWPTHGPAPSALFLPTFHVRKGFPFSIELGARGIYLNQSQMMAGQLEAKWALNEGFVFIPDVAVRSAVTRLIGNRDWDLTTADLDIEIGKRFPVMGVMTLTPYGIFRITWMNSQTSVIDFGTTHPGATTPGDPNEMTRSQTLFPELQMGDHSFMRGTLGLRLVTYIVTLGIEGSYFPGKKFAASSDYPEYQIPSAFYGSFRLGFSF